MTVYDLPKDLEPIQAIVNEAGAYQELDQVITDIFPDRINQSATGTKTNIEAIRQKMSNWLAYGKYDRVLEEHQKIIDEGIYSMDAFIGLYSICAEHKLPRISMLETASFDLDKENIIRVILENNKDQNDLKMIHDLVERNRENLEKTQYELGERYKNGINVEQSDSEAFKCYTFNDDLDRKLKSKIVMPYGIMSGMTVEEVNKCMKCAGFQFSISTNNGQTIYYRSSIDQGIQVYSTLISAFSNGVIHVIHFFKEEDKYSKENPSINYKKILSALIDRYGKVSYSIENGSFAWVNDSVEIHFGYLVTDGILYYVLAYWYLPDNIKYNGF